MLKKIAVVWMLCSYAFAESDKGLQYVARYAMQTVRSKNFKDLAENLFTDAKSKENVILFLKKNEILNRSLPDIVAEGTVLTVKERSQNTTLDLSLVDQKKLIFNGQEIVFAGDEVFIDVYRAFVKKHKRKHTWFSWFFPEAEAALPVLAVVTLSSYALAVIREETPAPVVQSKSQVKMKKANR